MNETMHDRSVLMTMLAIIAAFIIGITILGCTSPKQKMLYSAPCGRNTELQVVRVKEFVELSYQNAYYLYYKRSGEKPIRLTGTVGTLPLATRYKKMIRIEELNGGIVGSMFGIHYIHPDLISSEEFTAVVDTYRQHRNEWIEIQKTIDILVYGDQRMFHEIFSCDNGFFLYTDLNGGITITDNADYAMLSSIPEKHHFNNIGTFDDTNLLHFRKGMIISGIEQDLYGKPAKKVRFKGIGDEKDYDDFVETLWVDILYNKTSTGINASFLLSAKNAEGKRLDEIFVYKE